MIINATKSSPGSIEPLYLPEEKPYLPADTKARIEMVLSRSMYVAVLAAATSAVSFGASFVVATPILLPIALGALVIAVSSFALRFFIPSWIKKQDFNEIRQKVANWHGDTLIGKKTLKKWKLKIKNMEEFAKEANKVYQQEQECLASIDYLKRYQQSVPDIDVSLQSGKMTPNERKELIETAKNFRDNGLRACLLNLQSKSISKGDIILDNGVVRRLLLELTKEDDRTVRIKEFRQEGKHWKIINAEGEEIPGYLPHLLNNLMEELRLISSEDFQTLQQLVLRCSKEGA